MTDTHTIRTQNGVTASAGQRRGDVEIRKYLRDQVVPTRLCILLRSARSIAIGNNTLTIRTLFSPRHHKRIHTHARRIFASSFSTGPPRDRGAPHCHGNANATQPIGLVPNQARGILQGPEEQSRTRGGQSSRSPSSPPPSFTQSPSPARRTVTRRLFNVTVLQARERGGREREL